MHGDFPHFLKMGQKRKYLARLSPIYYNLEYIPNLSKGLLKIRLIALVGWLFFKLFYKYLDQISTCVPHFAKSDSKLFLIIIILLKLLVFAKHLFLFMDVCDFKWLEFDTLTRYITTNTGVIQPSLTRSKWNRHATNFLFEIPLGKKGHFYYWICTFDQTPPF